MTKKLSELFGQGINVSIPTCQLLTADDLDTDLTYDINGNLVSMTTIHGTKLFSYDVNGNLVSISGDGCYKSKSFIYDGNGNLIDVEVL